MTSPLETLRTARLVLTRIGLRPDDRADLRRMHRDPEVMATLGGVRSDELTDEILEQLSAHWREHGFGYWMAHAAGDDAFVGRGGLRQVALGGVPEIEVGYALLPAYWGRGLATELAGECVRIGFEELACTDLVAFTLPTNTRSRRVMERLGFIYERDVVWAGMPHVLYRLTARAWKAARRARPAPPSR